MASIVHKYMPAEMSVEERVATFAARQHTLDYLVKVLRDQASAESLNSLLVTGPRGAGKTTLVLMLLHAIDSDALLRSAWLPVHFPEELPAVTSLRDLMSEALAVLAESGIATAGDWRAKADAETDSDDQSLEIATTGLHEIARAQGKRLVFLVENLDMVFERGLDDAQEAHLRRLLMDEPFFMIVGTSVRLFSGVTDYEKAFFNFFNEVPLDRLNDAQVEEMLLKRADFHHNETFKQNYRRHSPSVRAISRLTGGNPRLVAMLYEVLSQREILPVVNLLRQIIDELTPLLKDVLERLPKQQSKVIDALMRKGGTASPNELVEPTRLKLNAINTQLSRLRDAQLVEVRGGGKGRKAYYTVPDQLFCTWYQMRYLRPNRRRIEMIVEFLRVCFAESDRAEHLRSISSKGLCGTRDQALTAEYFAASLVGTAHEVFAREAAVKFWIQVGELTEAAFALEEFETVVGESSDKLKYAAAAHGKLGVWLQEHEDLETAIQAYQEALRQDPDDIDMQLKLAEVLFVRGTYSLVIEHCISIIENYYASVEQIARALYLRGIAKGQIGDWIGAVSDYSEVISLHNVPRVWISLALFVRGVAKSQIDDRNGSIADYNMALEFAEIPTGAAIQALCFRGIMKGLSGDSGGAMLDFSAVIEFSGAPDYLVAEALMRRGDEKSKNGDVKGAMEDYSACSEVREAPSEVVVRALFLRGNDYLFCGKFSESIRDFASIMSNDKVSRRQMALAQFVSGLAYFGMGNSKQAAENFRMSISSTDLSDDDFIHLISLIVRRRIVNERYLQLLNELALPLLRNVGDAKLLKEGILSILGALADLHESTSWLAFWNDLKSALPDQHELFELLAPVERFLETGDDTEIDRLPVDQRALVETMLEKFRDRGADTVKGVKP